VRAPGSEIRRCFTSRKTSSLFKEFSASSAAVNVDDQHHSRSLEVVASLDYSEPNLRRPRGSSAGAKTALATPVVCVPTRGGVSVVHVRAAARAH
jgi:hypothetical protein